MKLLEKLKAPLDVQVTRIVTRQFPNLYFAGAIRLTAPSSFLGGG